MRLKSFYANTMTEAMQMVRDALGDDAVIVATREERGGPSRGGGVRVTAAIDPSANDGGIYSDDEDFDTMDDLNQLERDNVNFETHNRNRAAAARDWLQYDSEEEDAPIVEEITDAMLRHGVTEDVMDHVLSCATVVGLETPGVALMAAIEHLFNFSPLPKTGYSKAMMMVGAPGTGKTLAVAKIAARGVMEDLNVGVVSMDTVRAGGIEQLQSFTNLLGINLKTAQNITELRHALDELGGVDQVIIDTAGINPFAKDDVRHIAKIIGLGHIEPYAVMACGMDAEESGEMARAFSMIGVEKMIATRIDMARRMGGLLSAAHQGGLAIADSSNTPKVADGLIEMTPKTLSKLLMPAAFRDTLVGQDPQEKRKAGQFS